MVDVVDALFAFRTRDWCSELKNVILMFDPANRLLEFFRSRPRSLQWGFLRFWKPNWFLCWGLQLLFFFLSDSTGPFEYKPYPLIFFSNFYFSIPQNDHQKCLGLRAFLISQQREPIGVNLPQHHNHHHPMPYNVQIVRYSPHSYLKGVEG